MDGDDQELRTLQSNELWLANVEVVPDFNTTPHAGTFQPLYHLSTTKIKFSHALYN